MTNIADRVRETTTSTGTGTINLAGAESKFRGFVAAALGGLPVYYTIVHRTADEWENGIGTITDGAPDTLSRTTILSSSNGGAAVSFSEGIKDVACTVPAARLAVGESFSYFDPDKPPAIAHALDDEFIGSSLAAGWTWRNQGAATAAVANGRLTLTAPANAGNQIRMIEKTAPGGSYRQRIKCRPAPAVFNNVMAGLAFQVSGKLVTFGLSVVDGSMELDVFRWTNVTTATGAPVAALDLWLFNAGDSIYLEAEYDGTNLIFRYSMDAETWIQLHTETAATHLGAAPATIGPFANSNTASAAAVHMAEWWRVRTSAGAEGGMRSIGGSIPGTGFHCKLRRTADQALANSAFGATLVQWDAEISDPDNMHDLAVNPSRIVTPYSKPLWLQAGIRFLDTAGTYYQIYIQKNGTNQIGAALSRGNGSGFVGDYQVSAFDPDAAAGDYYEVFAGSSSASQTVAFVSATHPLTFFQAWGR